MAGDGDAKREESGPAAKRRKALASTRATLHYQQVVPGKRVGRYINREDAGEVADVHDVREVDVHSARELAQPPTLGTHCFELRRWPTQVADFSDDKRVADAYYKEMEGLVREATGAEKVIVFDHTVRNTTVAKLNSLHAGGASGAVMRVHTDYSDKSGPARLRTLAESGGYTGVKLSDAELKEFLARDFMIVNVWRSISDEPIQTKPLAVLDESTLDQSDFLPYEMHYPERVGENYSLTFNKRHMWYYYPRMVKDECLVFKTYESRKDVLRYCFHTAIDDPETREDAPPRRSVEVRCVAVMPRS